MNDINKIFFFPTTQQLPVGQGLLITEHSRSHSDTPHSVGLHWTRDRPDAENTDNTQHSHETDIHDPGGVQTRNSRKRAAADPRMRPRGHWDRHKIDNTKVNRADPDTRAVQGVGLRSLECWYRGFESR